MLFSHPLSVVMTTDDRSLEEKKAKNESSTKMARSTISSFVFLDLEATGLGMRRPRITELSLVAVHRDAFSETSSSSVPRVINKMTVCCYPMKGIDPGASNITGLYNDNLFHQKDFDPGMGDLISLFLKRLAPPVCLIAHNGNYFDYPLLKAELERVGKSLPDGIVCADSLLAFRDLDGYVMEDWLAKKSTQYIRVKPGVEVDVSGDTSDSSVNTTPVKEITTPSVTPVSTPQKVAVKVNEVSTSCSNVTPRDGPPTLPCVMKDDWDEDEELAMPLPGDVRNDVDPRTNTEVTPEMQMIKTVEPKKASKYIGPGVNIPVNSAITPVVEPDPEGVQSVKRKLFAEGAGKKEKSRPVKRRLFSMSESNKCESTDGVSALNGEGDFHLSSDFIIEGGSSSDEEGTVEDPLPKSGSGDSQCESSGLDSQQTLPYDCEAVTEPAEVDTSSDWDELAGYEHVSDTDLVSAVDGATALSNDMSGGPITSAVTPESKRPASCFTTPQTPSTFTAEFAVPSTSTGVKSQLSSPSNRSRATLSPMTPTSQWYPPTPSTGGKPNQITTPPSSQKKLSYKLSDVHTRVVGHPPRCSHRAEDDCLALVKIFKKLTPEVLNWVDHHAIPFTEFLPMYEGKCDLNKQTDVFPYQL